MNYPDPHAEAGPRNAAIVYCEGAFRSLDGKTAHGLVRRSERYRVLSVIDSTCAGHDAGELLDGRRREIPVVDGLAAALALDGGLPPTHLVVGLAPVGGSLDDQARTALGEAIDAGLHVHSGLHDFVADDATLAARARASGVELFDVRRSPPRSELHRFCGKIAEVESLKVAVLGTDSGIGKRTTAWLLVDALRDSGRTAELVGTGQTAWLQGARFSVVIDALVYDFVPGEIEHVVWSAWNERRPDVLVLEGQGGLLSPGYFGGQELLVAARPDLVVLQHAPGRAEYDGCPGFAVDPLERQLAAVRALSRAPLAAITIGRQGLREDEVPAVCSEVARATGLEVVDVQGEGCGRLVESLLPSLERRRASGG